MEFFFVFIFIMLACLGIVAWLTAISMFIDAAKAKGYTMSETKYMWFVGIFLTPITAGLYVAALPDKSNK